jgi:fructose-1,6-bisphosphatase/inositol monophosphatase family enzyme
MSKLVEAIAAALFERQHNSQFAHNVLTEMLFGKAHVTYAEVAKGIADGVYTANSLSAVHADARAALSAIEREGYVIMPFAVLDLIKTHDPQLYDAAVSASPKQG